MERRYSQIEREALAIVWAVERFRSYRYGIIFTLITENKPFVGMLSSESRKILPPRIQRLSWRLLQYKFEHVDGKHNIAHSILRLPALHRVSSAVSEACEEFVRLVVHDSLSDLKAVTLEYIRRETANDEVLSKLLECVKTGDWSEYTAVR